MALIPSYVQNKFEADNMQCFGDLTTDTLEANTLTIHNLNVITVDVETLGATAGNIVTLESTTVNGSNVNGGVGNITDLLTTNINDTDLSTGQLNYYVSNVSQRAVTTRLTAADLATDLKNTPFVLDSVAIESNQVAVPVSAVLSYRFGTTAFTNLSNISYGIISLGFSSGSPHASTSFGTPMVATDILASTVDVFVSVANLDTSPNVLGLAVAVWAGAPLALKQVGSSGGSPASGDGTLDVIMVYDIITLPGV